MSASGQQKCGLAFCAVCCILFGGAIAACGLLFQYHDDYDEDLVNGMNNEYYYTQYWLGAPLIVLGVVILSFLCCKAKPLLYVCIFLSSLTLVLAITSVVLEGPKWRRWLAIRRIALDNDEKEDGNGFCVGGLLPISLQLSCKEILYATLMQSVLVACSIMAIVVSQFVAFISIGALGWMTQAPYEMNKTAHHNQHIYNGSSSVNIMSQM